jgi:cytochrome c oxidase subunit 2
MYDVPDDAAEVYVLGRQWMWELRHPGGKREINELHVPVGRPVRLTMTSQDVIHSFFIPAFRIKQDVVPGRYTSLWFQATKPGRYHLFCAEYCGTDHSGMVGSVVAMDPADFQQWLEEGTAEESMSVAGERLFRQLGCSGCHAPNATVRAPLLEGVFGHPVPLDGGSFVQADERYIRDSILLPATQVVAGYKPVMPTFQGHISEEDLLKIVAYIKAIGKDERVEQ